MRSFVSYIFKTIKSSRKRWPGHVGRMREMRNVYKILVGKLKGKYHSEDLDVGGS
jgi:hypothetical protein